MPDFNGNHPKAYSFLQVGRVFGVGECHYFLRGNHSLMNNLNIILTFNHSNSENREKILIGYLIK